MSSHTLLGLLVMLVGVPASIGNPTGAPRSACVEMSPSHNNTTPQMAANPFSLEVDKYVIPDTKTLKVCVVGKKFKGILLQMRKVGGKDPVGTFNKPTAKTANDTKLMTCTKAADTVTHSKPSEKPSGTCFIWKAPEEDVPNKIYFVATIVESFDVFWVKTTSKEISGVTAPDAVFTTIAACSLLSIVSSLMR